MLNFNSFDLSLENIIQYKSKNVTTFLFTECPLSNHRVASNQTKLVSEIPSIVEN